MSGASSYELNERRKIMEWMEPSSKGFFARAAAMVNKPFELVGDVIMEIPMADWVVEKSVGGILSLANDAAQWSVRPSAILGEYAPPLATLDDVFGRDLREVDLAIGYLGAKYKGLAATEGAAAGVAGVAGIAIDIPALVLLNLRAIGEYATYCGFDVSLEQERLHALQILGFASSPTDAAKQVAMAELVKIAGDVARKKAWKDLQEYAFVRMIQEVAKQLGIRLTKAKLAQVVPLTGAVVGAGFNSYYTARVCESAYHMYRRRFLMEKYGEDFVA